MKKNKISLSKMRRLLWLMGMFKIPMIAFVRPKLILLDENSSQIRIKLKRRTKNHLKSMYFGSLAVGADMAAGLHAFYFAEESGVKVSFAFKAVKAEFLKRAMSDVYFNSDEGQLVKQAFDEAMSTKERVNKWIKVEAKNTDNEIVAVFEMEISVKVKS
jgi:acyl-coenzyme A thioesterase PaaI-like protein